MTMSTPNKDFLTSKPIFGLVLLVAAILILAPYWSRYIWPEKPPPKPEGESAQVEKEKEKEKPPPAEKEPVKKPAPAPVPEEKVPDEWKKVVTLGAPGSHLTVKLNPRGAGVLQIVLNHFQAADPKTGNPVWLDAARKEEKPLELVPEDRNREIASFLLYHYSDQKGEDYPFDTLGQRIWERDTPEEVNADQPVQEAVFHTVVQGVKITKKFTLQPRDYHIGLEVKLELADPQSKERTFRYQLTGAHGIPIEGQWYTSIFRNTIIGQVDDKDYIERKLQDLREISLKGGGEEVVRGDKPIRYAVVNNQFFASGIAVQTRDQENKDFLGQARPILMESAVRGKLVIVPDDKDGGEVELRDAAGAKHVFLYSPNNVRFGTEESKEDDRKRVARALVAGAEVIVVHRSVIDRTGKSQEILTDVLDPTQTAPIFHDDVTVEVSTAKDDKIIKVKPGEAVVHKYVLYNGPLKVRLLNHLTLSEPAGGQPIGAPAVDPEEVTFYLKDLHLDTLTDYPTSWMGRAFSNIGLTQLVLWLTNLMHDILWWLYLALKYVTPDILTKGLCILVLTVLVRGIMHPVSRKQARTTMRMQSLQPELVKLKEKFKDDKQALQMAQMELYRKHGINPLGSCWMMFLQMPVFLGLYYCLQESIHFRLAPFLWIKSLTAPDMLVHWGDNIPFISRWENYGAMYYLGPYFNVLPVLAVVFMILQQKYTMPPAADEQAAMQQKWMKYSMILFGLFFYKVAAGLCLYFIASSLWGFAERKLLPKKKPGDLPTPATPSRPTLMQRMLDRLMEAQKQKTGGGNGAVASPPAASSVQGGAGKRKRAPVAPEPDGLLARVRAWWAEVLKQAAKK
jgi:YidC/Oxa1 family membrane protein insertase